MEQLLFFGYLTKNLNIVSSKQGKSKAPGEKSVVEKKIENWKDYEKKKKKRKRNK